MTIAERLGASKREGTPFNGEGMAGANAPAKPPRLPQDLLVILAMMLATGGGFGLGILAGREGGGGGRDEVPWIEALAAGAATVTPAVDGEVVPPGAPEPVTTGAATKAAASGGKLVASKTGTKYYLPWCGTAKRIKEENKVWFASKAEAEAAGYEPAKNCKGL
ncbi:MAG TPA: Ada metal-binding domain-containing protein [Candidatus Paceibacterota bacterium]|jgi:hypothetical protein